MNGNRGAKGSVNDRLISIMYRNRYKEYLKKKESYTADERRRQKEYLEKMREFDIDYGMDNLEPEDKKTLEETLAPLKDVDMPSSQSKSAEAEAISSDAKAIESKPVLTDNDINTLINLGGKVSTFDPEKENFDFDLYDYYEIINTKSKVADLDEDDVLDVDEEIDKREDEAIILEEVTDFIDESKELLSEIKFTINDIQAEINNQHTQEEIEALEARYLELKAKLDKLRSQYLIMRDKYNFEDYEALENLTLMSAIDDYRDKARLEELEGLVDACKQEVEEIDGLVVEEERRRVVGAAIEDKEEEIETRDTAFKGTKKKNIYLDDLEKQIADEASRQQKLVAEIDAHLDKVETEVVTTTRYIYNTGQMFASFLRITAGILTAPFSNRSLFGIMLGSGLINRGIRDLRASLTPREVEQTEIKERYQSIEREILSTKDVVGTTLKIIDDSIEQLDDLQKDFKLKFEPYAEYIPEYRKVEQMMEKLQKKLKDKKQKVNEMHQTLTKQYEKNKEKVLRAS